MVMWLMGSDEETKAAVAGYFNDPASFSRDGKSNSGPFGGGDASNKASGSNGRFEEKSVQQPSYAPPINLEEYAILKDLNSYYEGSAFTADADADSVRYNITPRLKFEIGVTTVPNNVESRTLLLRMIDIFKQHDGIVVIEGYADEKQDWALAFGRAIAVKQLLEASGISSEKLVPMAGFDTQEDGRLRNLDLKNTGSVRFILKRKRK
jgi:flagellar motor protein MotB